MGRYIIRRLVWATVTLLLIALITYVIFFVLTPGDPATLFAGRQPTRELVAQVREEFGLDEPLLVSTARS